MSGVGRSTVVSSEERMVDPDRLRSGLGSLETYLRGLEEKQSFSREAYRQDRDLRDVVERRFEKAIQRSLDIAGHVVAAEGYREPTNYGDLFDILGEEGVLPPSVAEDMVEMAGFRNVLVHEYARIDDDRVYDHLQDLERFRAFARALSGFLDVRES